MNQTSRSPLLIAASILVLATGWTLAAPPTGPGGGPDARGHGHSGHGYGHGAAGPMMDVFHQLDLTEDQREQLRTIVHEQMQGELGQRVRDEVETRRAMRRLIHDPASTDAAIIDAARAGAVASEQLALARHGLTVALFDVLTEEQRAEARALIEERADDEFQPGRRGRRGAPPFGE